MNTTILAGALPLIRKWIAERDLAVTLCVTRMKRIPGNIVAHVMIIGPDADVAKVMNRWHYRIWKI